MKRYDAKNAMISVYAGYTSVTCINPDGEIIFKRGFPTGNHSLKPLSNAMSDTDSLEFGSDCDVYLKQSRVFSVPYGEGANQSGANPDFQVTSASRNAREMEIKMKSLTQKMASIDRRTAQLTDLERLSEKSVPDSDAVVIDNDDSPPPQAPLASKTIAPVAAASNE